ncbi:peptidoglycan-binding protein LysM [Streptomyces albipurpureus]|uniref:Peptidoglycan-binding protein LysM n=1 Tax=Streptomyces albipurpureus TaxID=2897419 RepID=A0ABT0UWJ6_9ACTN|nr:peptidoglycan-binding protein LysM [Streptomyces sp. CWNU-1]MCM2391718.1 peptidoglycan-binding protein LysM [Streptomyces sp. CWNU-1]
MGEIWIKEAEKLGDGSIGGAMDSPSAPGRAIWHTTESGHGDTSFAAVDGHLRRIGAEPHILYDPTTDRLGQYGPLNQSARALRNDGLTRTNRTGRVCIQVEILARASKPFTGYWKPGPNFRALMRAIRSWDVPDVWPAGALATSGSSKTSRSRTTWATKGGHYGHANVPGNDHWDPGPIDKPAIFKAANVEEKPPAAKPSPTRQTVSLAALVYCATHSAADEATREYEGHVAVVQDALVAEGRLKKGSFDRGVFDVATKAAYAAEQLAQGYKGDAADGVPGKASLTKLGSKRAFNVKV